MLDGKGGPNEFSANAGQPSQASGRSASVQSSPKVTQVDNSMDSFDDDIPF